jgi:hypothetical protein
VLHESHPADADEAAVLHRDLRKKLDAEHPAIVSRRPTANSLTLATAWSLQPRSTGWPLRLYLRIVETAYNLNEGV